MSFCARIFSSFIVEENRLMPANHFQTVACNNNAVESIKKGKVYVL